MNRFSSLRRGFTLIEILVVVAIIALLISILLPSLSRAREQARMIACESNIRQLTTAELMYVSANRGRFTVDRGATDFGYDWLGRNSPRGIPEGGAIWRYMNKAKNAYSCPSETRKGNGWWHYGKNSMLSGATGELAVGAHYPTYPITSGFAMDRADHRTRMTNFNGVPLFCEKDWYGLQANTDGEWIDEDGFETRHMATPDRFSGLATIGYHDGHAGTIKLPRPNDKSVSGWKTMYFAAADMCIRVSARKWVNGGDVSVSKTKGAYGILATKGDTSKKTHN